MAGEWTKERREKAAARCRANKPWKKSTGPKSDAGKMRSSLNALQHGFYSKHSEEFEAFCKAHWASIKLTAAMSQNDFLRFNLADKVIQKKHQKRDKPLI